MSRTSLLRHLFRSLAGRGPQAARRPAPRKAALGVESLEVRSLLDAGLVAGAGPIREGLFDRFEVIQIKPADDLLIHQEPRFDLEDFRIIDIKARDNIFLDDHIKLGDLLRQRVPELSSLPGAPATLYLNFAGDSRTNWTSRDADNNVLTYGPQVVARFDTDGDPNTFTDAERQQITEIWERVAEDFAPFNVNVTTVDPGNLDDGRTVMVNIGDSNGWYGTNNSGISNRNSFTNEYLNVVYAFTEHMSGKGDAGFVGRAADTAAHEAGHAFGLEHHQILNDDFSVKTEYDPGTATWTPIMGDNLAGDRMTWGIGVHSIKMTDGTFRLGVQTDVAVIARRANGFGFRGDEAGDTLALARPLAFNWAGTATVTGVVGVHGKWYDDEQDLPSLSADTDVYSFTTTGGDVSVRADILGHANGANLRVRVELWTADQMVAAADSGAGIAAVLNVNLPGGKYFVNLSSGGGIAYTGQYTLTVAKPDLQVIGRLDRVPRVIQVGGFDGFAADQPIPFADGDEVEIAPEDAPPDAEPMDLAPPDDAVWIDEGDEVVLEEPPVELPPQVDLVWVQGWEMDDVAPPEVAPDDHQDVPVRDERLDLPVVNLPAVIDNPELLHRPLGVDQVEPQRPPVVPIQAVVAAPIAPVAPLGEVNPSLTRKRNQFTLRLVDKATGQELTTRYFRGKVAVNRVDLDGDGRLDIQVQVRVGKRVQTLGFSGIDGRPI